ncbi:monooxygenase, partial [Campylobacter sp.]|uniref:monooxygenase n=1 Tax=Campylobacter sp. TaxID=205 RepID=UPI0026FF0DB1|nr:monooxygenase [Campylobacter sp.]
MINLAKLFKGVRVVVLQVVFDYNGGYGEEMYNQCLELAQSIAKESGFIWKIWTENKDKNIAGGIYAFKSAKEAESYVKMHAKRLEDFGVASNFRYEILDV